MMMNLFKSSRLRIALVTTTGLFLSAAPAFSADNTATAESPVFAVSLLKMASDGPSADRRFQRYLNKTERILNRVGGNFVTAPIAMDGQHAGADASTMDFDYITIAQLPNDAKLGRYLRSVKALHLTEAKIFALENRFSATAVQIPWLDAPLIPAEVTPRPAPAMILVNGATLKAQSDALLEAYFNSATQAAPDTRYLAVLKKQKDLRGTYPHAFLMLSEWADAQSFASVQADPHWQAAQAVREQALTSFSQARGQLLTGDTER